MSFVAVDMSLEWYKQQKDVSFIAVVVFLVLLLKLSRT